MTAKPQRISITTTAPEDESEEPAPLSPIRFAPSSLPKLSASPLKSALKQTVHSPGLSTSFDATADYFPGNLMARMPTTGSVASTSSAAVCSPMPSPGYKRGVAFDTLATESESRGTGGTGVEYAFTLRAKSEGYLRTATTREFVVATDVRIVLA